jgi:uncharacterized protein with PIN domain
VNIYLDTSALVKLYIEEDGSDIVNHRTEKATIVSTSRIAYSEAISAFVRCKDEKVLSKNNYDKCITCFKFDWEMYFVLVVLRKEIDQSIDFTCWDDRLLKAAKKEGFKTWPE